jgi:hypothetical protein
MVEAPEKDQCGQRPTGRRQPARGTNPWQCQQQQRAKKKSCNTKKFSVAQAIDQGRCPQSEQSGDVRGGHDQADAQAKSFGVQFPGKIDNQR